MTIIVFLIDTSASMFQRTYVSGRTTILDVAKSAVEHFVKLRQRSPDSRIDRYMLLTFEEPPNNIKAGWKENLTTFMNELKNLQCYSMTTMGVAVKQAFDILNINRMTSGIDTYGQGRCPFFLETALIVVITDGGKLSTVNGVHEEFHLPMMNHIPGSEMTREPFRWDQRLFALVLRLTGTPAVERDAGLVPGDGSPIDAMCDVTGGRSYSITSQRMLHQCIDSLVQKVQNGVVINFEKIGPDPPLVNEKGEEIGKEEAERENTTEASNDNDRMMAISQGNTSWYSCRRMIYVPRNAAQKGYPLGFWPIPESFWPELTASALPPRTAHPNIKFTCTSSDPMVIENLPFDKYELEPSPLTQYILARKQPTVCWQVFVSNSSKNSDVGHPFGYLKASTNLSCVNLFVMPYNYPVLLPLLDELFKVHRWKPTAEWRNQFQNYMRTLPAYYANPVRRGLIRMGTPTQLAQSLIPENAENCLSYTVMNYLKKLKNQAKVEQDKLCTDIIQRQSVMTGWKNQFNTPEQIRVIPKVLIKKDLVSHPMLCDKFNALKEQLIDHTTLYIGTMDKERNTINLRNPFDIPRSRLMQQVAYMRNNFLQSDWVVQDQDSAHALPVSQMGNYQEYLKRQTPQLREIESAPVRQHMFGNPFKIDKRMMVDEADIDLMAASPGGVNRGLKRTNSVTIEATARIPSKRKPGPLPRDLVVRRLSVDVSPPSSPMSSPLPSPVPWLAGYDKVQSFTEELPVLGNHLVNGNTSPHEEPRAPSPTNQLEPTAYMNHAEMNMNSFVEPRNDFECAQTDDRQISAILKEANSAVNCNSHVNNNNVLATNEVKPELKVIEAHAHCFFLESRQEVESANYEVRKTLNKLVRRPGKNFAELFDSLRTLRGTVDVQVSVVKLIIKESLRFKRQHLANLLEDHIQALITSDHK